MAFIYFILCYLFKGGRYYILSDEVRTFGLNRINYQGISVFVVGVQANNVFL